MLKHCWDIDDDDDKNYHTHNKMYSIPALYWTSSFVAVIAGKIHKILKIKKTFIIFKPKSSNCRIDDSVVLYCLEFLFICSLFLYNLLYSKSYCLHSPYQANWLQTLSLVFFQGRARHVLSHYGPFGFALSFSPLY